MQELATAGVLEPGLADSLLRETQRAMAVQDANGDPTALVVPATLRPALARFLRHPFSQLGVLSSAELPEERQIRITATIGAGA
jgi:flagellar biosynthesis protein FlhA